MNTKLTKCFLGVGLCLGGIGFSQETANAVPIGPNQSYMIGNATSGRPNHSNISFFVSSGGRNYLLSSVTPFGSDSTVRTSGATNGGYLDQVNLNIPSFNVDLYEYSGQIGAGSVGAKVGTASGSMSYGWGNVRYHNRPDFNLAGAIGDLHNPGGPNKESNSAGSVLELSFNTNDAFLRGLSLNFSLAAKYVDPFLPAGSLAAYEKVRSVLTGFPAEFSMALGDTAPGYESGFSAWFMSAANATVDSRQFSLVGDVHGQLFASEAPPTDVPEPATLGLLATALIGAKAKRRKS